MKKKCYGFGLFLFLGISAAVCGSDAKADDMSAPKYRCALSEDKEELLLWTNSTGTESPSRLLVGVPKPQKKISDLVLSIADWESYTIPGYGAEQTDPVVIDLSKYSNVKDNYLLVKTEAESDREAVLIEIPKSNSFTAASLVSFSEEEDDGTVGIVSLKNNKSGIGEGDGFSFSVDREGMEIVPYHGSNEKYQTGLYFQLSGPGLETYEYNGTTLYITETSEKDVTPAKVKSISYNNETYYSERNIFINVHEQEARLDEIIRLPIRPSKPVKLTFPKRPAAPKIKVDYEMGKLTVPAKTNYVFYPEINGGDNTGNSSMTFYVGLDIEVPAEVGSFSAETWGAAKGAYEEIGTKPGYTVFDVKPAVTNGTWDIYSENGVSEEKKYLEAAIEYKGNQYVIKMTNYNVGQAYVVSAGLYVPDAMGTGYDIFGTKKLGKPSTDGSENLKKPSTLTINTGIKTYDDLCEVLKDIWVQVRYVGDKNSKVLPGGNYVFAGEGTELEHHDETFTVDNDGDKSTEHEVLTEKRWDDYMLDLFGSFKYYKGTKYEDIKGENLLCSAADTEDDFKLMLPGDGNTSVIVTYDVPKDNEELAEERKNLFSASKIDAVTKSGKPVKLNFNIKDKDGKLVGFSFKMPASDVTIRPKPIVEKN